jgi:membrane protein
MAEAEASAPQNWIDRVIAWALTLRAVRAFLHYLEHRGPMLADSVTYRALFSVFAGVLLGFSVAGLWLNDNPLAFQALVDAVDAAIPGLFDVVDPSEIGLPPGLELAGVLSLFALVGASIGAIGSLRAALYTLADHAFDDVFWIWVLVRNFLLALGIGAAFVVTAIAGFYANVGIDALTEWFGLSPSDPGAIIVPRIAGITLVFLLDVAVVAVLFIVLSGVRAGWRPVLTGAVLGGAGLSVLQQLSGWFVAGAGANPLLASFAALIALLLWFNLSSQVILIASSFIIVTVKEEADRVRVKYGATSFALRRVQRAEDAVRVATDELRLAREDLPK